MIRRISIVVMVMIMIATSAMIASAANCNKMWVRSVSSTEYGTGAATWLINQSGSVCGTIPNGGEGNFFLPTDSANKMMATLLTAMTLQKTVWVAFDDSTNPGSLMVVAINNYPTAQ